MKRSADERKARTFRICGELIEVLGGDLQDAASRVRQGFSEAKENPEPSVRNDILFWTRASTRIFCALCEGVSGALRRYALEAAEYGETELSASKKAELAERNLENGQVGSQLVPNSVHRNLSLGIRHYASAAGLGFEPRIGGPGWEALTYLVRVRRRLTHPDCMEDLYPLDAACLLPAAANAVLTLLGDLAAASLPRLQFRAASGIEPIKAPPVAKLQAIAEGSDIYEEARARGLSRALVALLLQHRRIDAEELGYAMSLCSHTLRKVATRKGVRALPTPRSLRLLTWSFFAELELMANLHRRIILDEASTGEVAVTVEQRHKLKLQRDVLLRVADTADLFAKLNGSPAAVSREGDKWHGLIVTRSFRDLITHPRTASDLQGQPGTFDATICAIDWFKEEFLRVVTE